MSEMKPKEDPSPGSFATEPRSVCALCGRDDSGAWYWSEELKRVICVDCHWRVSTPPPTTAGVRKP